MKIEENVSLSQMTTFRIGGPARYYCVATTLDDVEEAFTYAESKQLPVFILGGGSNILVSDEGYNGLVIKISMQGIEKQEDEQRIFFTVGAGCAWDSFVESAVLCGGWGIENLSAIPGTVGGAVVQNIGAYGSEVKDIVSAVQVYDRKLRSVRTLSNEECRFAYRESIWKHEGEHLVVMTVTFCLKKNGKPHLRYKDLANYFDENEANSPSLLDIRSAIMKIRCAKFPDLSKYGTAGSFFKNPIVTVDVANQFLEEYPDAPHYDLLNGNIKLSAAWIIDHVVQMKGVRIGSVGCFDAQALVVVNYGGASSEEIKKFTHDIELRTKKITNITLEPEVIFI